jgi:hypothetical protein
MAAIDTTGSYWRDFDAAWYQQNYPIEDDPRIADLLKKVESKTPANIYAALVKPLEHSPNLHFSESWYLSRYAGVRQAVDSGIFLSGFDHFCRHGHADLMPHWLFDPSYYRVQFHNANGRTFDPSVDGDLYDHFLRVGQHQGLTGHWFFDPSVYQATAAFDVASRAKTYGPFTTFLMHIGTDAEEPVVSNLFAPDWYRSRYPTVAKDVAEQRWTCGLHHYLTNDNPTVFDPSRNFSEQVYFSCWPDVAAAVSDGRFRNGFMHFCLHGRKEGRFFAPSSASGPASPSTMSWVTAKFPLTTRTFKTVSFLPCEPDPASPSQYTFGVLGADRQILREFNHIWITMRSSNAIAAHCAGSYIYGGVLTSHFGHILRDGLANLWFIRQNPELPILWHWLDLPVAHDAWPTWLDEIWQILGLDKHRHHRITSPITVDQVILPDPGLLALNVLHKTQALALATLKPDTEWLGHRVWLSRSGLPAKFGAIEGETEVERLLAARGWKILHPENLPVTEQTNVFATAAIVAGCLGSAFHAVLLTTSPRAKLILVDRPGIEHTYYDAVAGARDLKQFYLTPDLEPFTTSHPWARFKLVNPQHLADAVCELAAAISA